jgi:hypothetical protein
MADITLDSIETAVGIAASVLGDEVEVESIVEGIYGISTDLNLPICS